MLEVGGMVVSGYHKNILDFADSKILHSTPKN